MSPVSRPLKDEAPVLASLIRTLARTRLQDMSRRSDADLQDYPGIDELVYASHQALIQIAAKSFRITLKTHFSLTSGAALARGAGHLQVDARHSYDFFMEYSNLLAGGVSQHLQKAGIVAGISLPLATSGFDELIASDRLRLGSLTDAWVLSGPDYTVFGTVVLESEDLSELRNLKIEDDDSAGDVEFL